MPSARCRGPKGAGSRKVPGAGRCREPEGAGSRKVPKEPGRTRKPGPGEIEGTREARKEPNENEGPVARRVPRLFCLLVLPVVRRSLAGLWLTVGRSLAGCSADYICRLLPVLTGFQAVPPVVCWSFVGCLPGFPGMPTASPSVRGQFTGFVCRGSRSTGSSPAAAGVICQFCSAGFVGVR